MIKLKDILFEGNTSNETDLDNLFDELEDDIKQVELEPKNVDEANRINISRYCIVFTSNYFFDRKICKFANQNTILKKDVRR